jgi:hypothetical protein
MKSIKLEDGNYNPVLLQGIISPAPLLPVEQNGTGEISFKFGNTGDYPMIFDIDKPEYCVLLTIKLSNGIPNNVDPLSSISGSVSYMFDWTYDSLSNTFFGRQNQTIPGSKIGLITIQYKVTKNSTDNEILNGFDVKLTSPEYAISNTKGDDQVSCYTWTEYSPLINEIIIQFFYKVL